MKANDMTFGIEIETIAPQSAVENDGLQIGGYHHGIQVPYLPQGWRAERDGSINASGGGLPCEVVSPILRGPDGLGQVAEVLRTLEAKGHRVNVSCGVHIHVGWKSEWPTQALARLVTIVAYAERGLYAITGTKRRERGTYCGGVRKYGNDKDAKPVLDRNRYHALNLTNLANHTRETVEFRVFSGSLKAVKVLGWIQVCLGLVERSLNTKRTPKWHPTPLKGGWKKAGEPLRPSAQFTATDTPAGLSQDPKHALLLGVEHALGDPLVGDEQHPPREVLRQLACPSSRVTIDRRRIACCRARVDKGQTTGFFLSPRPERPAVAVGPCQFGVHEVSQAVEDRPSVVCIWHDSRVGVLVAQIAAGLEVTPPAGRLEDCAGNILLTRSLARRRRVGFEYQQACDEAVTQAVGGERFEEMLGDGRAVDADAGLVDDAVALLVGLAARGESPLDSPVRIEYIGGSGQGGLSDGDGQA